MIIICSILMMVFCITAIIGGGIGGASTAHFLSGMVKRPIILDLYEGNELGGRIATTVINNVLYEIGGTIAHMRNRYMLEFLSKYGTVSFHYFIFICT